MVLSIRNKSIDYQRTHHQPIFTSENHFKSPVCIANSIRSDIGRGLWKLLQKEPSYTHTHIRMHARLTNIKNAVKMWLCGVFFFLLSFKWHWNGEQEFKIVNRQSRLSQCLICHFFRFVSTLLCSYVYVFLFLFCLTVFGAWESLCLTECVMLLLPFVTPSTLCKPFFLSAFAVNVVELALLIAP